MSKNQVYIAIIVVCVAITAGLLYYNSRSSGGGATLPPGVAPINTNIDPVPTQPTQGSAGSLPTPNGIVDHGVPAVFPMDSNLDTSIFSSSRFQALTDYIPLTVAPDEIGRENPHANY